MKRIYFGMIPVPWIFAGLLFLNGKLDHIPSNSDSHQPWSANSLNSGLPRKPTAGGHLLARRTAN